MDTRSPIVLSGLLPFCLGRTRMAAASEELTGRSYGVPPAIVRRCMLCSFGPCRHNEQVPLMHMLKA